MLIKTTRGAIKRRTGLFSKPKNFRIMNGIPEIRKLQNLAAPNQNNAENTYGDIMLRNMLPSSSQENSQGITVLNPSTNSAATSWF